MKLKFVKLIRVPITVEMPDGTSRDGYRYMDIDGKVIAESLKGEVYPSAIREQEIEAQLESMAQKQKEEQTAQTEAEAQAEWDAMRTQMMKNAASMGVKKG